MTYSADLDQDILGKVLLNPTCYIGMVGSSNKWRQMQNNLTLAGLTEKDFAQVKCPIGNKNCGRSPKEIAVGIAAELLSFHYGK